MTLAPGTVALAALSLIACATTQPATPADGREAVAAPGAAAPPSQGARWTLGPLRTYEGYCDASGLVVLGDGRLAVADDEHNVLAIYDELGGPAGQVVDLTDVLALGARSPEADVEDLVRRGDELVIVTSHGRRKSGKEAPSRQRVASARLAVAPDGQVALSAAGAPYTQLVELLTRDDALAPLGLAAAAALSPKVAGGLNVEGVSDGPGGELLIGLRSPLVQGKAVVVVLADAPGAAPRVVGHHLIDLGGRGVRGLARRGGTYWIAAGAPVDEAIGAALYTWQPGAADAGPHPVPAELGDLNVESIAALEDGSLIVLADDGAREIDGVACKKLKDAGRRMFRGARLRPSAAAGAPSTVTAPAPRATPAASRPAP